MGEARMKNTLYYEFNLSLHHIEKEMMHVADKPYEQIS